ncbi:MAG TPA: histidine kinase, partial [Flavobacteriaceae bacterium]|nr:histidine kinase [Flavobacteriaceae bacterium]
VERYVWIGNRSSELNYYWFFPSNVQRFLLPESLRSLYALNENRILASTEFSGWYEVNLEKNTVDSFKTFRGKEPFQLNYTRNIIPANDSTKVWTNYRYGIAKVDLKTHQLENWEGLAIECLARWNDSTLVYGTMDQSLMAFDTKTKVHRSLLKTDSLWILALAATEDKIFGATDKGLLVYNGEKAETRFYKVSQKTEDNYLLSILKTNEDDFLLGTKSGKVFRFHPPTQKFELMYEDELKAPVASMIFYANKLWINTFNGFIGFDIKTGETERYSTLNGFSSNEANRYSTLATENGLLVGTVHGLNFFQPKEIDSFENSCRLVPLSMTFYDEEKGDLRKIRNRELLENGKRIELPVNNRFFQLNFGMGSCFSPVGATFKYRLDDNPWVQIKQGRYVRLESLAPGTYELEVAAFDFSGKEIGKSLKFELVAHDFFVRTFWFKILAFLLLLLMISVIYFNRLKKIKKEQALRTSISSDLHDEVGGLLTGISMRAEILESTDLPEDMQKDFVKSIAVSSKEAVQAMRDVVWSIDARKDDWDSLLFRLREYGNRLFEDINIHFTLETKGVPPKTLSQKIRQETYLICKEALNNSAKHASATKVRVEFYFSHHRTKILIADNGKGMDGSETSGQGLKNMNMRAEKIKAKLNIDSSESGTKITILLK